LTISLLCAFRLCVFSDIIEIDDSDYIDGEPYSVVHFAQLWRHCTSMSTFLFNLKFSLVRSFRKYNDSMFFTWENVVHTKPCFHIPVVSNETPSSVKPCDLCIMHAHASGLETAFRSYLTYLCCHQYWSFNFLYRYPGLWGVWVI
jgi:hypothetical protein